MKSEGERKSRVLPVISWFLFLLVPLVVILIAPVSAGGVLIADFLLQPDAGTAPLTVKMTDESTGSPSEVFWQFGDGAFSFNPDPVHTYRDPGVFTVSLAITDRDGNSRVQKKILMVRREWRADLAKTMRGLFAGSALSAGGRETTKWPAFQGSDENLASIHKRLVLPLTQETMTGKHTIIFNQSGLPPGLNWSVILVSDRGTRLEKTSSSSTLCFSGMEGDYSYSIPLVKFGKKNVNISAIPASGRVAADEGRVSVQFSHFEPSWSGYVMASNVTEPKPVVSSVRGTWRVPELSGSPEEMTPVFQWIGIGGFFPGDKNNLIQTGTASCIGGMCPVQYNFGWTEILPDTIETIPSGFIILPGDIMQAGIREEIPGTWNVTLEDMTRDWHYQRTFLYNSSKDSAEWVLENPSYVGETYDLASFGVAAFGTGTIPEGNTATIGPAEVPVGSFPGFSITMVHNNTSRAIPSEVSPEGDFTIRDYGQDPGSAG